MPFDDMAPIFRCPDGSYGVAAPYIDDWGEGPRAMPTVVVSCKSFEFGVHPNTFEMHYEPVTLGAFQFLIWLRQK